MKYIVCVDWKAGYSSGFDYYPLKSDNILDAMEEAEQYINENVYLITVMEKQKGVKRVKGCPDVKEMTYTDVITNRGNGWHRKNVMNGMTKTKKFTRSTIRLFVR